jgi:hypothetical protein
MKNSLLLSTIAAALLATGCAVTETTAAREKGTKVEKPDDGEVLTGTRLPRKSRVTAEHTKFIPAESYKDSQRERQGDGVGMKGN